MEDKVYGQYTGLLFKFKALDSLQSINYAFDIIDNNRLYLSRVNELNDPFEGYIDLLSGKTSEHFQCLNKLGIVSLSTDCFSQLMWANYTHTYNGICIGFNSYPDSSFFTYSQEVSYNDRPYWTTEIGTQFSLTRKHKEWAYEKERRIIQNRTDCNETGKYFQFKSEDIACIIVGFKVCERLKEYIKKEYSAFPVFEVRQMQKEYGLYLYSYRDKTVINSLEELNRYITNEEENK